MVIRLWKLLGKSFRDVEHEYTVKYFVLLDITKELW